MFDKFLNGTINQVTMAAALRRSNTYADGATNKQRKVFREGLCQMLDHMMQSYECEVSEENHLDNIKKIQKYSSSHHRPALRGGKIKFGVAQKALNLYLKLQWSQNKVAEPPHCPLDAVIIKKLPRKYHCNWTKMTSIAQYKSLIKAVKNIADKEGKSIAEWELVAYQE